jgi:hypothetical protein
MRRVSLFVLGSGLFVALSAGIAGAGSQVVLTIEPTAGPPGTVITGTVQFCDDGSDSMRLEILDPGGQVVADTGFFNPTGVVGVGQQGTITVPEGASPGAYTVRVTCNNLPPDISMDTAPFEVTGAATAAASPAEAIVETPAFTG